MSVLRVLALPQRARADHPTPTRAVIHEMATLLNTGLNRQALTALVQLVELGINPHALAHVVREMQREAQAMQQVGSRAPRARLALDTHNLRDVRPRAQQTEPAA